MHSESFGTVNDVLPTRELGEPAGQECAETFRPSPPISPARYP